MMLKKLLASSAIVFSGFAFSAQQQNAYIYVNWQTSATANYTTLDQQVQISQKTTSTFWAATWLWNASTSGGYLGLQTNGSRIDGTVGDTVIFSVWNATAASGNCEPFAGEGVGYSCRVAYPFTTTGKYRLKLGKGLSTAQGQWWKASIVDVATYKETVIGSLLAAVNNTELQLPQNFTEYFGPAVYSCADVPQSIANWSPTKMLPTGAYLTVSPSYRSYLRGSCTGGSAASTYVMYLPVVQVKLGGAL